MINRFFVLFAVVVMLAGCETASNLTADAGADDASASASGAGSGDDSTSGAGSDDDSTSGAGADDASASASASGTGSGDEQAQSSVAVTPYVPETPEDILSVEIGNRVNFDFDSAALTDAAKVTLDRQAAFLQSNPAVRITVEGHADERGTREYNLALGARRASAARDYLVARGIDGLRIRTISYGKERPEVIGSHEEAWARNRRAVSIIR